MFTFDLYDKTGTRPLLPAEVLCIFQDIHGEEEMKTNPHAQRLDMTNLTNPHVTTF